MLSSNWTRLIIATLIGIALGVIYGWAIDPIEYTDVTPNILRKDYRVDYVLMVAEANQRENDSATAARRLAILGSETPVQIVSDALDFATQNDFSAEEVSALEGLLTPMQTYQPQGINSP